MLVECVCKSSQRLHLFNAHTYVSVTHVQLTVSWHDLRKTRLSACGSSENLIPRACHSCFAAKL